MHHRFLKFIHSLTIQALVFVGLVSISRTPSLAQIPSGALMWLKADAGISSGQGLVSRWQDQSGHANSATQTVSGSQPTVVLKAVNGLPAVNFNGSVYMNGPSVFPVQSDYSLTFVVKIANFALNNNVVSGTSYAHYFGGSSDPIVLHNANFNVQAISTIPVTLAFNVVTITYQQSKKLASIYVNGFFADSTEIDPNSDSTMYLGAYQATAFLGGELAEVTLYNRVLSTSDRSQLESYLFTKYAITLPQAYGSPAPSAKMWLRADTGVVLSNGLVSKWFDESGTGIVATQDSTAFQPTLVKNDRFTLPAVRFNGSSDFMQTQSIFPIQSDYTLTFVIQVANLAATNNVISGTSYAHYFGGNPYLKVLHGNFATLATSTIPIVQSDFTIVTVTYLETRQRAIIYINGNFADSAFVGTNLDSVLYLGAFQKANLFDGDISEALLYPRELSLVDREATESYLFKKYGIFAPPPPPPPDSTFGQVPKAEQLYARGTDDSAVVPIAGALRVAGYDSIFVSIAKNGLPWKYLSAPLIYAEGKASFNLSPTIHAELSEYQFTIGAKSPSSDTILNVRDSIVCGDAYIIDGQSNAIYFGPNIMNEFGRTFGINFSPNPSDTSWGLARDDADGNGPDIGAWGMALEASLLTNVQVPICIINGAVSGTSIEQHAREVANPTDQTTIYGSLLYRAIKSGLSQKMKALFWDQGESNTITNYYNNFNVLYHNWLSDYPALKKFYVVQIRPGCAYLNNDLRDLLRTLTDSLPNIQPVSVMGVPGHDGCHFSITALGGYDTIGTQMSRLVIRDFYASSDTIDIVGPDISKAFYTDTTNTTIAVVFDNAKHGLYATDDTMLGTVNGTLENAFFVDDSIYIIRSVTLRADTAYLSLLVPYQAKTVSFIPGEYPNTTTTFEGPWIKNMMGIGAFSFYHFPVLTSGQALGVRPLAESDFDVLATPNPFSLATEIHLSATHASTMRVAVYDLLGREVFRKSVYVHPGDNEITFGRAGLGSGKYFCKVSSEDGDRIISLVIE